jgi:2-oxoglutarate dehydrogenase E1 component
VGYRRFGHNEADEPAYTQPGMAALIKGKRPARDLYADQLIEQGTISREDSTPWRSGSGTSSPRATASSRSSSPPPGRRPAHGRLRARPHRLPRGQDRRVVDRLRVLNEELLAFPDGFNVHPKLGRQLEKRRDALGTEGGHRLGARRGARLRVAALEGTPVRLTGQDSERGTFSQRHLVLHDAKTGQRVSPIQNLPGALAPMELHNSPLSEIACLGYEYGYSMEAPTRSCSGRPSSATS